MDSFQIYTERAVENIKDSNSRPLGSHKIKKTKVERLLVDNL